MMKLPSVKPNFVCYLIFKYTKNQIVKLLGNSGGHSKSVGATCDSLVAGWTALVLWFVCSIVKWEVPAI